MISEQTALSELQHMKDYFAEYAQRKSTGVPVVEYTRETSTKYGAGDISVTGYEILLGYFNLVWSGVCDDNPESGFTT